LAALTPQRLARFGVPAAIAEKFGSAIQMSMRVKKQCETAVRQLTKRLLGREVSLQASTLQELASIATQSRNALDRLRDPVTLVQFLRVARALLTDLLAGDAAEDARKWLIPGLEVLEAVVEALVTKDFTKFGAFLVNTIDGLGSKEIKEGVEMLLSVSQLSIRLKAGGEAGFKLDGSVSKLTADIVQAVLQRGFRMKPGDPMVTAATTLCNCIINILLAVRGRLPIDNVSEEIRELASVLGLVRREDGLMSDEVLRVLIASAAGDKVGLGRGLVDIVEKVPGVSMPRDVLRGIVAAAMGDHTRVAEVKCLLSFFKVPEELGMGLFAATAARSASLIKQYVPMFATYNGIGTDAALATALVCVSKRVGDVESLEPLCKRLSVPVGMLSGMLDLCSLSRPVDQRRLKEVLADEDVVALAARLGVRNESWLQTFLPIVNGNTRAVSAALSRVLPRTKILDKDPMRHVRIPLGLCRLLCLTGMNDLNGVLGNLMSPGMFTEHKDHMKMAHFRTEQANETSDIIMLTPADVMMCGFARQGYDATSETYRFIDSTFPLDVLVRRLRAAGDAGVNEAVLHAAVADAAEQSVLGTEGYPPFTPSEATMAPLLEGADRRENPRQFVRRIVTQRVSRDRCLRRAAARALAYVATRVACEYVEAHGFSAENAYYAASAANEAVASFAEAIKPALAHLNDRAHKWAHQMIPERVDGSEGVVGVVELAVRHVMVKLHGASTEELQVEDVDGGDGMLRRRSSTVTRQLQAGQLTSSLVENSHLLLSHTAATEANCVAMPWKCSCKTIRRRWHETSGEWSSGHSCT
jgi:hypothetical protein